MVLSPFWALASLIRCLHSSLFSALLLHPLIPSSCNTSLWTTSAHLFLGLPTGLVVWKFLFKAFFGKISSSILIMCPAHRNLLVSLRGYYLSIGSHGLGEGNTSAQRVFLVTLRLGVDHSFFGFLSVPTFLLSALGRLAAAAAVRGPSDLLPILHWSYTDAQGMLVM